MNQLKTTLCVLCLGLGSSLLAQSPQQISPEATLLVKAVVVDDQGKPLPGAVVQVRGKKQGVVANERGEVSLYVDKNTVIVFSSMGMRPKILTVSTPFQGKITLEDDVQTLNQVVVTGYTRTTQRRSTGSTASLQADQIKTAPTANMDALLQGKLVGVDVKTVSGRPGESAKIRIRGTNTISGNADPLWVVDGVPLQRDIPKISQSRVLSKDFSDIFANGISGINPNDIESITVLKDASAAAIYGSRAAGGVIVVTTKRGKAGKLSVSYAANLSLITRPPRSLSLMDSKEKLAWEQELWDEFSAEPFKNGTRYPVIGAVGMIRSGYGDYKGWSTAQQDAEIARLGEQSTNWFDELFRQSISHSHYLSLSGGSDKQTYYVSMGYTNNKGLLLRDNYNRYNVSGKLDMKLSRRLKAGLSLDLSMQDATSASLYVNPFTYAYFANPYERVRNTDGSWATDNTYRLLKKVNGGYDNTLPPNGFSLMREMEETSNKTKNITASAIANLSYQLTDQLSLEGLASYGYVGSNSDNENGKSSFAAWQDRPFGDDASQRTYGSIAQSSAYNLSYNLRGQLRYSNTFTGQHSLSVLLGSEVRGQYAKSIFAKRYGYDPISGNSAMPVYPEGTNVDYGRLQSYAQIMDALSGQNVSEDAFASFYFSTDYIWRNRYIASVTARMDGSNNFGSKEQFNPTGSIGLGWNVDRESFMKPLSPVLSSLTLRAAVGYTGNINRSVYPQLVMDYRNSFRRTDTDYYRIGFIKNAPNPRLRWEKTRDAKLGIDIGLLEDRIRISAEVYDRHTYDAVSDITIPGSAGFPTQKYNTSELLNRGAELQITGRILQTEDWRLSATANIAYNRNKLLRFDPPQSGLFSGQYQGYPLGSIFSGKLRAIDPQLGIYSYQPRPDVELNTPADRNNAQNYIYYVGPSTSPYTGGYNISVGYRNLSLSLGGSFSLGGLTVDEINYPATYTTIGERVVERIPTVENDLYIHHLNVERKVRSRWTEANPQTSGRPRLIDAYGAYLGLENYVPSSGTITRASRLQDVSFFKIGSLSLSYSLPSDWSKSYLGLSSVALSFTANNLLILSPYKGLDPEQPGATYPMPQTYTFGLSVGL